MASRARARARRGGGGSDARSFPVPQGAATWGRGCEGGGEAAPPHGLGGAGGRAAGSAGPHPAAGWEPSFRGAGDRAWPRKRRREGGRWLRSARARRGTKGGEVGAVPSPEPRRRVRERGARVLLRPAARGGTGASRRLCAARGGPRSAAPADKFP